VVVLYVDQQESVKRQMARAQLQALHNTWVLCGCLSNSARIWLIGRVFGQVCALCGKELPFLVCMPVNCLTCRRALDAGTEDQVRELRQTDVDEAKCRARYTVFKWVVAVLA
jgi:hypothetical protein